MKPVDFDSYLNPVAYLFIIFALYPFRVNDSSVIADFPVEKPREFKMMI
jgi:hypothetical protein